MAFETVHLVRIIEFDLECSGAIALTLSSDLPGNAMAPREWLTIPATPGGRRTVRFRLSGTTKGKLFQYELIPSAVMRLYGGRVFAKPLGGGADWAWFALPVEPTPAEWTPVKLPIEATSEEWTAIKLPIEDTSEEWTWVKMPIVPTSDEQLWQEFPVAL